MISHYQAVRESFQPSTYFMIVQMLPSPPRVLIGGIFEKYAYLNY
jgi:hypothetical protein